MNRVVVMASAALISLVAFTGVALADIPAPQDPEDGCGCATIGTRDLVPGALALGVTGLGLAWVLRSRKR